MSEPKELWKPSEKRVKDSELSRFRAFVESKNDLGFDSYQELHRYSLDPRFWQDLASFYDVEWSGESEPICNDLSFESYGWFPQQKLNFAKNMLKKGRDEDCALHFVHESGFDQKISYSELRKKTKSFQAGLQKINFNRADVVAAYMPNTAETVISMLGATSLGGVFTSTSADFGVNGVVDRFGQSKPRVLVSVSHYEYNGKTYSLVPKLKEIAKELAFIEKIVVVNFLGKASEQDLKELSGMAQVVLWDDFCVESDDAPDFVDVSFQDPLYIMYSSGTTGKPKCIIHSVGGTLLQHIKELGLHSNLTQDKNIFYFTTCGWMMWNWLVSSLYFGSQVTLYEGSPGFPSLGSFVEIIDRCQLDLFGTSPKFLKALQDSGYSNESGFKSLETILSTGAPLLPEQYDYVYEHLKKDVCLSSICGGTDIIGCFMLGNPNLPVHGGELQCLGLGMDVQAVNEQGKAVIDQEGELVCAQSFPSMPLGFLADDDRSKMNEAYFNHFTGLWYHGDFIKITKDGGALVMGRSDATLNPGGVRIGTAEIYRQTEQLTWLEDSACVGRSFEGDVQVILFVKMKNGEELDQARVVEIKSRIKSHTTPRHVPTHVWSVTDIPYTRSGKKMELAITRLINGRELTNVEAVANPECLGQYDEYKV